MLEPGWLRWIGPGVIAALAVGSVASTTLGAGPHPWVSRACGIESGGPAAAARAQGPAGLDDLHQEAWFRVDASLDRTGALEGQRLALGMDGNRSSGVMDLPPESFAAGPFGRIVLIGADDGVVSRLEAVDVARECSWAVAEVADVVRRATIDLARATIYELRVDRATRADLGIWARPLDGSLPAVLVLEPLDADSRFGRTWTTEFAWDVSGRVLAVQSCGEVACRTRVIDPAGGPPLVLAEPDLGAMIGLDGALLATYAACPGFPCPILAVDLPTGARRILAEAGAVAVVIPTADGPRVVHEVLTDSGVALRAIALDGSFISDLGRMPDGARLVATPNAAGSSTRVPPGWVALGPGGRLPADGPNAQTKLRHVPDGITVPLDEVVR